MTGDLCVVSPASIAARGVLVLDSRTKVIASWGVETGATGMHVRR